MLLGKNGVKIKKEYKKEVVTLENFWELVENIAPNKKIMILEYENESKQYKSLVKEISFIKENFKFLKQDLDTFQFNEIHKVSISSIINNQLIETKNIDGYSKAELQYNEHCYIYYKFFNENNEKFISLKLGNKEKKYKLKEYSDYCFKRRRGYIDITTMDSLKKMFGDKEEVFHDFCIKAFRKYLGVFSE